jgi:hypothetical protein
MRAETHDSAKGDVSHGRPLHLQVLEPVNVNWPTFGEQVITPIKPPSRNFLQEFCGSFARKWSLFARSFFPPKMPGRNDSSELIICPRS